MNTSQNKVCQNCKNEFHIEPEDFEFYAKIKVPPPTFCPDCRLQRRMAWRNERSLYKRTCDLCKGSVVSIYSPDKPHIVYCDNCFHGDGWDPLSYGVDVDFSRPFLDQYRELQLKVPRLYAFVFNNVNSEYVNGAAFNKNCYLIFVSDHNEESMYSYSIFNCKNVVDSLNCSESELCYEAVTCKKCYRVYYSQDCSDSQNLYFCKNCVNCHDCVGSVNLRNAQYVIFNKQYSKDEYFKALKELGLESRNSLAELKSKARNSWPRFISKYIHGLQNKDVVGDYIFNSKNVVRGFDSELLEDSRYINFGNKAKDCYDGYVVVDNCELSYEVTSAIALQNVKASYCVWHDFNVQYSDTCENSNNLFGCVSLRKKEYCILNKQYTKEEYERLLPKIIDHMNAIPFKDAKGRIYKYGEFFPVELSPFAYNETAAQEHFARDEQMAKDAGFLWRAQDVKNQKAEISPAELPDTIAGIGDDIAGKSIGCEHEGKCNEQCSLAFRITPDELEFYKKMNIPVPMLCQNCRHFQRLAQKNPLKLWDSKCMCAGAKSDNASYTNVQEHFHKADHCPNAFQTTYSPERREIIYCEQCYQTEVA